MPLQPRRMMQQRLQRQLWVGVGVGARSSRGRCCRSSRRRSCRSGQGPEVSAPAGAEDAAGRGQVTGCLCSRRGCSSSIRGGCCYCSGRGISCGSRSGPEVAVADAKHVATATAAKDAATAAPKGAAGRVGVGEEAAAENGSRGSGSPLEAPSYESARGHKLLLLQRMMLQQQQLQRVLRFGIWVTDCCSNRRGCCSSL